MPLRTLTDVPSGLISITLAVKAVSCASEETKSRARITPSQVKSASSGAETKLITSLRQFGPGCTRLPFSCKSCRRHSAPWEGTGFSGL